jgi:hypothetical protein
MALVGFHQSSSANMVHDIRVEHRDGGFVDSEFVGAVPEVLRVQIPEEGGIGRSPCVLV